MPGRLLRGDNAKMMGVVLAAASACEPAQAEQCLCSDPAVVVAVPPERASALAGVQLSGEACAEATPTCTEPAGTGCASLTFVASRAGGCTIDLQFATGPAEFQATVTFYELPCCAGYYAEPPESAAIAVPGGSGG